MPAFPRSTTARHCAAAAALTLATGPALATDFTDPVSVIDALLCVGPDCATYTVEAPITGASGLKLKGPSLSIRFEDTGPTAASDRDWQITANSNATSENFYIYDAEAGTAPFWINGGAPSNALRIGSSGNIGIGTSFPQDLLHIVSYYKPAITLEQDGSGGFTPYEWRMVADNNEFLIKGGNNNAFRIKGGAPHDALIVGSSGNVGFGYGAYPNEPAASLDVLRSNGSAQIRVRETSTASAPRTLLTLQNNGRPEIVLANTGTGGEWSFGAGTNFVLKQGAVGSASNAKTKLFEIDDSGNATLAGALITGGPSCAGGCDAVFAADYALPSIADHAARMFALGHLPNVGPTAPGAPVNLSERYGRILNELEHAHIYIAQQEDRLTRQTARIARQEAQIAGQAARLARLEARLSASGG